MTSFTKFLLTIVAALGLVPRWATQDDGRVDLLLAGLGLPGTVESLVKLGQSDPEARSARLPSAYRPGWQKTHRWIRRYHRAGGQMVLRWRASSRIVEAVPALIKHMVMLTHAESGLSSSYEFRNRAAVQALLKSASPRFPQLSRGSDTGTRCNAKPRRTFSARSRET